MKTLIQIVGPMGCGKSELIETMLKGKKAIHLNSHWPRVRSFQGCFENTQAVIITEWIPALRPLVHEWMDGEHMVLERQRKQPIVVRTPELWIWEGYGPLLDFDGPTKIWKVSRE